MNQIWRGWWKGHVFTHGIQVWLREGATFSWFSSTTAECLWCFNYDNELTRIVVYDLVETRLIFLFMQSAPRVLWTRFKQHRATAWPILYALVSSYLRKCERFINVGSIAFRNIKQSSIILITNFRLMNSYFVHAEVASRVEVTCGDHGL